jgi:hypothetical protein
MPSVAGGVRSEGITLDRTPQPALGSLSGRYRMLTKPRNHLCAAFTGICPAECLSRLSTLKADAPIVANAHAVTDIR